MGGAYRSISFVTDLPSLRDGFVDPFTGLPSLRDGFIDPFLLLPIFRHYRSSVTTGLPSLRDGFVDPFFLLPIFRHYRSSVPTGRVCGSILFCYRSSSRKDGFINAVPEGP